MSSGGVKLVNINFGILGPTALYVQGGVDEHWGTPRVRALLAALLVHAGRAVPHDRLLAWMWPDDDSMPENPAAAFHTYSTRLRRCLDQVRLPVQLHSSNGVCYLQVDPAKVDYFLFQTLVQQARDRMRKDDPAGARVRADEALLLWRGTPLQDLSSEPAKAWRMRVQDEWAAANRVLVNALLQLQEFDVALARIDEAIGDHGLDLALATLRLPALYGLGRSSDATEFYLATRRHLLHEGDDVAAERLRRAHDELRGQSGEPFPRTLVPEPAPPRQLRHDVLNFVGRDDLLRELDDATTSAAGDATNSVVAVDGMAGVGKTALVVHWGHANRHRFPGGDFFINLHGYSDAAMIEPSAVIDDLLIALGVAPNQDQTPRVKEVLLGQLLATRRTLVVLDNARNSAQVETLVALLCSSTVIVTSRQRLTTLTAAVAVRRVLVPPLGRADAAVLLDTRLGSRLRIAPGERDHLVGLCGGLPLMLAVLAEHLAAGPWSEAGNHAHQIERHQMITDIGEDGDGPAVPETFLSWSYQALPVAEQRLFRLLSIHAGPDISAAAAAACDGRGHTTTLRSLRRLAGSHLLEQPAAFDRFQFHDLLREFAAHLAQRTDSSGERYVAERRLLSHYLIAAIEAHHTLYPGQPRAPAAEDLEDVEAVSFSSAQQAKQWFDRERNNLTAAVRQAAARSHHDLVWRLVDPVATFFDRHGYYDASRSVRELAVMSARSVGHTDAEASSLIGLGMVETILGDHGSAQNNLTVALRLVEDSGNKRGQGSALHQLARLQLQRGDTKAAVALYERCLDINQALGDVEGLSWTHCRIGAALRILGQYGQAIQHLHQARFHAQQIADDSALASCLIEIGAVYRDQGDPSAAVAYCEQALRAIEAMPIAELAIETHACLTLAEVDFQRGEHAAALAHLDRVDKVTDRTHSAADRARACELRGDIQHEQGRLPDAARAWHRASDLYEHTGNVNRVARLAEKVAGIPGIGVANWRR